VHQNSTVGIGQVVLLIVVVVAAQSTQLSHPPSIICTGSNLS